MIEVENLTKEYGDFRAIDGITFSVEKGEILGFLGPNGAGKTTTMRILTCFFPPTSGTAKVAGFDCFTESLEVRKRIGYLPESVPLYLEMKVKDYLEFAAGLKGVDPREVNKKVTKVMGDCGIEQMAGRLIKELSKGYRQRVGLAQALVNDPEVLILDEPTIGLDPRQIIEIRKLIKELAGRRTVILSTHILPEVSMICKRVIIINRGRLVAVDTPDNLTARVQGARRVALGVRGPVEVVKERLEAIKGVKTVVIDGKREDGSMGLTVEFEKGVDPRADIPRVIVNNGWDLVEMKTQELSLEDIFIRLITKEEGMVQ